jgi:ABC-2 type transport system ATP-binding protein
MGYAVRRAGRYWEVGLSDGQSIDPVVSMLLAGGLSLRHLVEKRQTLEDLFVQAVEAAEPGVDTRRREAPEPARRAGRA